jgi:hypothetical protein
MRLYSTERKPIIVRHISGVGRVSARGEGRVAGAIRRPDWHL